jgi:hydrogenase maturation protease
MTSNVSDNSEPELTSDQVLKRIPKTLILGYGNPDREDDGVAWYVLQGVAKYFNIQLSEDSDVGIFPEGYNLDFWFNLQMLPEMASEMLGYQRICFVDAHTGAIEKEIQIKNIKSVYQNSPLTHHMTAEAFVSILQHLYSHQPETLLVSIRGYQFRFSRSLSEKTNELSNQAINEIVEWIKLPLHKMSY